MPLPALLAFAIASYQEPDYKAAQHQWRTEVENRLKAENGWLSVAGLSWLKEGETTIGTDPNSGIVLPEGSAPANFGSILFAGGKARFRLSPGASATVEGQPIGEIDLRTDAEERPTRLKTGALTLTLIKRGERTGVRLYDAKAPTRTEFKGLRWYDIDPEWRVKARYVAYEQPKQLPITNVLGDTSPSVNPGYVEFVVAGKTVRLEAEEAGDGLFFNFKDLTNGKETYPAGRFLDAEKPKDGVVVLDFNRATNPPCAFTAFATCPLGPRANHLEVAIPAGEKH